jgi:hypothetical protein
MVKALAAIPPRDLKARVNDKVLQDYQRFREAVLEARPDLEGRLPAPFVMGAADAKSKATYLEVRARCERIRNLLTQSP